MEVFSRFSFVSASSSDRGGFVGCDDIFWYTILNILSKDPPPKQPKVPPPTPSLKGRGDPIAPKAWPQRRAVACWGPVGRVRAGARHGPCRPLRPLRLCETRHRGRGQSSNFKLFSARIFQIPTPKGSICLIYSLFHGYFFPRLPLFPYFCTRNIHNKHHETVEQDKTSLQVHLPHGTLRTHPLLRPDRSGPAVDAAAVHRLCAAEQHHAAQVAREPPERHRGLEAEQGRPAALALSIHVAKRVVQPLARDGKLHGGRLEGADQRGQGVLQRQLQRHGQLDGVGRPPAAQHRQAQRPHRAAGQPRLRRHRQQHPGADSTALCADSLLQGGHRGEPADA